MEHTADIRKILDRMVRRLAREYAPERILLFGSYAGGGAPGPDSDLDLLIIKETEARFLDRMTTVRRILAGTHRSLPVDVLVMTPQEIEKRLTKGDQFVEEMLREGEEIYAAERV